MYHDLTDPLIKSFPFPDNFAPWQASHRFKVAIVQYSGGLGSSSPGITLSCNLSSCSALAMMCPPKQSHNAIQQRSRPCLLTTLKVVNRIDHIRIFKCKYFLIYPPPPPPISLHGKLQFHSNTENTNMVYCPGNLIF